MKLSKPATNLVWVGLLAGLSRWGGVVVAVGAIIARELYQLRQSQGGWRTLTRWSPRWLVGLAVVLLIALAPQALGGWLLAAAYGLWLVWLEMGVNKPTAAVTAGVSQFLALAAIFTALAMWHWPITVVLILVWGSSALAAEQFLASYDDRTKGVLETAWALVASEAAWIFAVWLVNYVIPLRLGFGLLLTIVIPQAAIVLTGLGYCFGGIYEAHRKGRLNRGRLLEYLVIGVVLLVIVILGTRWSGVI